MYGTHGNTTISNAFKKIGIKMSEVLYNYSFDEAE
jgi:hypothetical protein